jgi:site-specific DNA-methyltransferase (adenine-specific)
MIEYINKANKMCGIELMLQCPDEMLSCAFFDPQYKDKTHNDNKAHAMNDEKILMFIRQYTRLLKPSGYLFVWIKKWHIVHFGNNNPLCMWSDDLVCVDVITREFALPILGVRTAEYADYLMVLQKKPVFLCEKWKKSNIMGHYKSKMRTKNPYEKPYSLIKKLITVCTEEGEIVGDFAAGTYSTMAACAHTLRNFIGADSFTTEEDVLKYLNLYSRKA